MKTLKFTALVLGVFALFAGTSTLARAQGYDDDVYQQDGYSNDGNISLQTFYDELSPYGTWIQDPQYGYVWRPDVEQSDFRPYYTNGRWVMTEYGNTWVSNYDWGWAPFHYGRWVINSYRQWIWLPDTNWGPAWVDWRSGDGYYGWAPMAPAININLSFGRRYVVPEFCWNFIPQANIYINLFPRYDYARNSIYYRNTTIINNTYIYNRRTYYGGPRAEDIRRATNRNVTVYRYNQNSRPGAGRISGREVSFYRPRPERNVDNRSAAPRKFEQGNVGFNRNGRNNDQANRSGNNDNRYDNRQGQPNRNSDNNVNRGNTNPQGNGNRYNRDANGRPDNRNGNPNVDRSQDQQRSQQMQQQRAERGQQQERMSQDQQRSQRDMQAQRSQADQQQRSAQMEQQRAQRDAQAQQQRTQQDQQQRSAQMEQQRAQRDAQVQQQRAQQAQQQQQQRAQRDAQVQQQRAQQAQQQQQQRAQQEQQQRSAQMEQQRAQRDAQAQQQRAQQAQQQQQRAQEQQQRRTEAPQQQQNRGGERSGSESGRPSRGGRG